MYNQTITHLQHSVNPEFLYEMQYVNTVKREWLF